MFAIDPLDEAMVGRIAKRTHYSSEQIRETFLFACVRAEFNHSHAWVALYVGVY
jgi:hypothetical protein